MVLSETRGLWLCSIVREGIGWLRRLACWKHGPDFTDCYFLASELRLTQDSAFPNSAMSV